MINPDTLKRAREIGSTRTKGARWAKSAIFVPLLIGGEAQGAISIQNLDREHAFTDSDLRLLQTLANSMSVALENARLFDETQRLLKEIEQRAAEMQILNTISQGLVKEQDFQSIIELVGVKLGEIFHSDNISIRLYDQATDILSYPYHIDEGQRAEIAPRPLGGKGLSWHIIQTRQPLVINRDLEARMAELGSYWLVKTVKENDRANLGVPILAGEEVIGLILLGAKVEDAFSESDVSLLTTLASNMGVALQNARLFEETQSLLEESEQRAAELSTVKTVSQALVAETELNTLIQLACEQIRQIFDADIAYIALHDRQTDLIHFPYQVGADLAANGLEVLQSLERQPYDLVLMDVQMPEMDGLEATRRVRQRWPGGKPHIIAMTANAMEGDREACLAAGMDDYIAKPIRVEEFVKALEKALAR